MARHQNRTDWPEAHRSNKLSLQQMVEIKTSRETSLSLAQRFGVSRSYVSQIKNGTRMKTAQGALDIFVSGSAFLL